MKTPRFSWALSCWFLLSSTSLAPAWAQGQLGLAAIASLALGIGLNATLFGGDQARELSAQFMAFKDNYATEGAALT